MSEEKYILKQIDGETIEELNKEIALFMGNTIRGNTVYFAMLQECKVNELDYLSSWDSLMNVISTIKDWITLKKGDLKPFYKIRNCIPGKNKTYKAVVQYIKNYNKNE